MNREKGKAFERMIAKMIVAKFAKTGITNKDCYRTPNSGGHPYANVVDPGDLVVSPKLLEYFPFHVECKHWKDIQIEHLFVEWKRWQPTWEFSQWFKQVYKAETSGREPIIVFRKNNGPILCATQRAGLNPSIRFLYKRDEWRVVTFERFLKSL